MKTKKIRTLILLVLVLVITWFNMDTSNDYSIPKVSQEDTSFYEVNPCKISLSEFLLSNPESIYQNHFYFRPDNRSSIQCFGRISGVTVLQKNLEKYKTPTSQQVLVRKIDFLKKKCKDQNDRIGKIYRFQYSFSILLLKKTIK